MTPEIKFRRLECRAMTRLSDPREDLKKIDLRRASVVVRIWRYPVFEPYQSWSLIKGVRAKEEYWLVRRTTWDRTMDYQRAHDPLQQAAFMIEPDPAPAINVLDALVHEYFVSTFMERLSEVTAPSLIGRAVIGLDGVTNGIETQDGRVHLEWWCDGPPPWRKFTAAVKRLRRELDTTVLASAAKH